MSANGVIDLDRLPRLPDGDYVTGFGRDQTEFTVEVIGEPPERAVQITFTDPETGEPVLVSAPAIGGLSGEVVDGDS